MQVAAAEDTNRIRDAVETAIAKLLREGEADLIRDARPTFEAADLDESQWSAWVDAWIDAAYEQHALRLSPVDFEAYTDWCTCGHSHADHVFHCSHALTCGCEKFQRSRSAKRPKVRVLTPDRWRENRIAGPELNPLAEVI